MITMKKISVFTIILGLLASLTASAASTSWSSSRRAPNVYFPNTQNSTFFTTPMSVPVGATIKTVSWSISTYGNGSIEQYQLCYTTRYSSTPKKCRDLPSYSGSTDHFYGEDAKGSFKIVGVLLGGYGYPLYPSHYNSITVHYQY